MDKKDLKNIFEHRKEEKEKFYIYVEYFYTPSALYPKADGALDGLVFKSRDSALEYLIEEFGSVLRVRGNQYAPRRWQLDVGEYDSPTFKIRKVRK